MARRDYFIAPLLEAALIAVISCAGWISHQPLIFASLGPTAFEIIETPERPSARPYNIILGNILAILAAYVSIVLVGAWSVPSISAAGIPFRRVCAATIASLLTVFFTLLLRANQPAALSTTLLISLGIMQTFKDGLLILVGVLLITAIGEPIRRWRISSCND